MLFPRPSYRRARGDRPLRKWLAPVLGQEMAYAQAGEGQPVVFIHGGPAASYLWRKVIPHLAHDAWCLAIDLIGTGDSDRLVPSGPQTYRMDDHRLYLDAFFDVLELGRVTLVVQGWGSMVAFDWAARNPDRVAALAHMESIVRPLIWRDLSPETRRLLKRARSPDGERFVLETWEYVEQSLGLEVLSPLHGAALDEYARALGDQPEERRCLWSALQTIPISGFPNESMDFVKSYGEWLRNSDIPKLFIRGEPGHWMAGRALKATLGLPNQVVHRVRGTHLLPEDSPDGVGLFLAGWYRQHVAQTGKSTARPV
jgi:haloalkane dehalogenase